MSLQQAMANTQVCNGFFVKRTADTKSTVAYLTLLTRFLKSKYQSLTITSVGHSVGGAGVVEHRTFDEFNSTTMKSQVGRGLRLPLNAHVQ